MQNSDWKFKVLIDFVVAHSIERYNEMHPDEAHTAIAAEWGEQMIEVFEALMFKATCGDSKGMTEFVEIERKDSDGVYLAPICTCEWGG